MGDHRCALASTLDHCIHLIDSETGSELASYRGHTNQRYKVQSTLNPSNALVVSGSEDHRVCFWDLEGGDMFASVAAHDSPVFCARFQGDTLVTAAGDGSIKVWDAAGAARRTQSRLRPKLQAVGATGENLPAAFGKKPRHQYGGRSIDSTTGSTTTPLAPPHAITAVLDDDLAGEADDSTMLAPKRKDR